MKILKSDKDDDNNESATVLLDDMDIIYEHRIMDNLDWKSNFVMESDQGMVSSQLFMCWLPFSPNPTIFRDSKKIVFCKDKAVAKGSMNNYWYLIHIVDHKIVQKKVSLSMIFGINAVSHEFVTSLFDKMISHLTYASVFQRSLNLNQILCLLNKTSGSQQQIQKFLCI